MRTSQEERVMEQDQEKKDGLSELINYLLTTLEKVQDKLPDGFTVDGLSVTKYSIESMSINFSFKKKVQ